MRPVIATTAVLVLAFVALIACGGTTAPSASFIVAESPTATVAATSAAPTTAAPTTDAPTTAAPTATATAAATTDAPTAAPTAAPTQAPTTAPTTTPTQAPTATPTQAPTVAPTPTPTPTPAGTPAPNFPGPVVTNASGPVPPSFARFGVKLVDGTSGLPVVGACVYTGPPAGCPSAHYISDSSGFVAMDLPAGSGWAFTVQHPAYKSLLQVPVTGGSNATLTMTRNP